MATFTQSWRDLIAISTREFRYHSFLTKKQGRVHGKIVADGWEGAVMYKPLEIHKYYRPIRQGEESRVRDYRF